MTPEQRRRLKRLDDLILGASPKELKKIQDIDRQTQADGLSLCDVYHDSGPLIYTKASDRPFDA